LSVSNLLLGAKAPRERVRKCGLVTGRTDTIVGVIPCTNDASSVQDVMERIAQKLPHPDANVVLRIADSDPELTVRAVLKLRPLAVADFGAIPLLEREYLLSRAFPVYPVQTSVHHIQRQTQPSTR
jgi:hypothetical protein